MKGVRRSHLETVRRSLVTVVRQGWHLSSGVAPAGGGEMEMSERGTRRRGIEAGVKNCILRGRERTEGRCGGERSNEI